MSVIQITGGGKLSGTLSVPGSKNAVLPMLAATLLFDAPVILKNVPAIRDAEVMLNLLESLGKKVEKKDGLVIINPGNPEHVAIDAGLAQRLRASVLLLGPLVGRFGECDLPHPGGDKIGPRPIDLHLGSLEKMGAKTQEKDRHYFVTGPLVGADIYLEIPTVTGTENLLLAASLAKGTTFIRNAAQEPHVENLAKLLAEAGVVIHGIGTSTLTIEGRDGRPLNAPADWTVPPDELDAGTFAIAALLTNGIITIHPFPKEPLRALTEKLSAIGADFVWLNNDTVTVQRKKPVLAGFNLKVGYAPGFPTDLQPPMTVLATQANGESSIHDWIYEQRFGYAKELRQFGADVTFVDDHQITVNGPTKLTGAHIASLDIRAGIAFVLAALIAEDNSTIDHAEIIERGYANLVGRLDALGAVISQDDDPGQQS